MFLSGWYLHKTCSPGYFPTDAIVDDSEMAKMTLVYLLFQLQANHMYLNKNIMQYNDRRTCNGYFQGRQFMV